MANPEADLALALRKYLAWTAPRVKLVAVPNAAKRTQWAARQAKKEGMATGFPDLVALWPGGGVGFLELKVGRTPLTDNQAEWLERLVAMGHRTGVARSIDEAVTWLRTWGAPVAEQAA